MVQLFGKSLLQRQIDIFRKCGIEDISIVTGYCKDSIKIPNITYFVNDRFETTNMVETLFCAEKKLSNSTIISYGDIIFETKVLEKLIRSKNDFSVIVDQNWKKYWSMRFESPLDDAESLIMNSELFLEDIGQKVNDEKNIQAQYIGLMKFQGSAINFIKKFYNNAKKISMVNGNILNFELPFEKSYMTDFIRGMIKNGCEIKAIPINGGWLELDSITDYNLYKRLELGNRLNDLIELEDG